MSYEVKDNTIAIFKNDKGDNSNRPDYRGTIMLEGKKYRVSLWLKNSATAGTYLQGQVAPDDAEYKKAALEEVNEKPAKNDKAVATDLPF